MEKDKGSDLSDLSGSVDDEVEGVHHYKKLAEKTENPELKKLYTELHGIEKTHVEKLRKHVDQMINEAMK